MRLLQLDNLKDAFLARLNSAGVQASRIADLGCGGNKFCSSIGMDITAAPGVDVIHDLNVRPYPFSNGQFDAVVMHHVIEHVESIPAVLDEVHRLLSPGGQALIATPHFTDVSSWSDATHRYHLGLQSFDFLVSRRQFIIRSRQVRLGGIWRDLGIEYFVNRTLGESYSDAARMWEAKYCFVIRGGEMVFWMEKR
jgi:2-polyprenyl-3-methyl-5-hydroxy-6-metoxy-1,4-benzoquinol methylase